MPHYRAYTVGDDGSFIACIDLLCDNDEAAIEEAKRLLDGRAIELWQGERRVVRMEGSR